MVLPVQFNKNDEWYTPKYAVEPLLEFIGEGRTIWAPFDTDESEFVKVLNGSQC